MSKSPKNCLTQSYQHFFCYHNIGKTITLGEMNVAVLIFTCDPFTQF